MGQSFAKPNSIKIVYFNLNGGRAQMARLALHMGGIPFEDVRFEFKDFKEHVQKAPMAAFPYMEVDGVRYCQGRAICRYAGKLAGLYPSDPISALKCDEMLDALEQLYDICRPTLGDRVSSEDERLRLRQQIAKNDIPKLFGQIEAILQSRNDTFVAGEEITIADLQVYVQYNWLTRGALDGIPKDILQCYAKYKEIARLVDAHPKVIEWNQKTGFKSLFTTSTTTGQT